MHARSPLTCAFFIPLCFGALQTLPRLLSGPWTVGPSAWKWNFRKTRASPLSDMRKTALQLPVAFPASLKLSLLPSWPHDAFPLLCLTSFLLQPSPFKHLWLRGELLLMNLEMVRGVDTSVPGARVSSGRREGDSRRQRGREGESCFS